MRIVSSDAFKPSEEALCAGAPVLPECNAPVVEPSRPDDVLRWLPPEVPKTPSPVAPCDPKSPGVEMPLCSALRRLPTPVSPVAIPPTGRFEELSIDLSSSIRDANVT